MSERINQSTPGLTPEAMSTEQLVQVSQIAHAHEVHNSIAAKPSETPYADLRESLSNQFGFKDVHNMSNQDIDTLIAEAGPVAEQRVKDARIDELKLILGSFNPDSKTPYADLRQTLSPIKGFKTIYNMNNLDLKKLVQDAKTELEILDPAPVTEEPKAPASSRKVEQANEAQPVKEPTPTEPKQIMPPKKLKELEASKRDKRKEPTLEEYIDQRSTDMRIKAPFVAEGAEDMQKRLEAARNKWLELNAKRTSKVFNRANSKLSKQVEAAYQEYLDLNDYVDVEVSRQMTAAGYTAEQVQGERDNSAMVEGVRASLARETIRFDNAQSRNPLARKFYQIWAKQGGKGSKFFSKDRLKGGVVKAAMLSPVGIAAGAVAGVAFAPAAIGAAGAALLAGGVARGLAGARLNQRAEEYNRSADSVSGLQARADINEILDDHTTAVEGNDGFTVFESSDRINDHMNAEVKRNRKRVLTGAAVGALAVTAIPGIRAAADGIGNPFNGIDNPFSNPFNDDNSGEGKGGVVDDGANENPNGNGADVDPGTGATETLDLDANDNRYPWTHFADKYGAGEATPRIMELVAKADANGWEIIGNGEGGGSGAIRAVVSPSGQRFTGNGNINAALDYIDAL